jgi:hypothetical protein
VADLFGSELHQPLAWSGERLRHVRIWHESDARTVSANDRYRWETGTDAGMAPLLPLIQTGNSESLVPSR